MKYKDYYASLGVARDASQADIKKAYRSLAHKYHPDVSKEPGAEAKFKEMGEAYQTLKDPEKRAAYDRLGTHVPGQDFTPPPDWGGDWGGNAGEEFSFNDIDLADLFAGLARDRSRGAGPRASGPLRGQDFDLEASISLEDAFHGALIDLHVSLPEYDAQGRLRRVPREFKARVPKGATDGQRLRLPGKGGHGFNGGPDGDLYLTISLLPHRLFRAKGHDLYIDLPLAPWEAALGATVEVPTLGGPVEMKVPAGTQTGQTLRLAKRGLPQRHEGSGDLFAIAQIVLPRTLTEQERALFEQLAAGSQFAPRAHLAGANP